MFHSILFIEQVIETIFMFSWFLSLIDALASNQLFISFRMFDSHVINLLCKFDLSYKEAARVQANKKQFHRMTKRKICVFIVAAFFNRASFTHFA